MYRLLSTVRKNGGTRSADPFSTSAEKETYSNRVSCTLSILYFGHVRYQLLVAGKPRRV